MNISYLFSVVQIKAVDFHKLTLALIDKLLVNDNTPLVMGATTRTTIWIDCQWPQEEHPAVIAPVPHREVIVSNAIS